MLCFSICVPGEIIDIIGRADGLLCKYWWMLNLNVLNATHQRLRFTAASHKYIKTVSCRNTRLVRNLGRNSCAINKIIFEALDTLRDLKSALQHYFPSHASDEYGWTINPLGNNELSKVKQFVYLKKAMNLFSPHFPKGDWVSFEFQSRNRILQSILKQSK